MKSTKEKTRQGSNRAGEIKQSSTVYAKSSKFDSKPIKIIYPTPLKNFLNEELAKPKSMRMISERQAEYIKVFASNFCGKWVHNHNSNGLCLNAKIMEKFNGKNLRPIKQWLKNVKFFDWDDGYEPGTCSKQYVLLSDLIDGNWTEEYVTRPLLIKKIRKWWDSKEKFLDGLSEEYQYAMSMMGKIELGPVSKEEIELIASKPRRRRRNKNGKGYKPGSTKEERVKIITDTVNDIHTNGFKTHTKCRSGRLHTNYLQLPKELRNKVFTKDGIPVDNEWDWSNNQMNTLLIGGLEFLYNEPSLNKLISKTVDEKHLEGLTYSKSVKFLYSLSPSISSNQHTISYSSIINNIPQMFGKIWKRKDLPKSEWLKNAPRDMQYYAKLCLSGKIYEFFQEKLEKTSDDPVKNAKYRKTVKKNVLTALFSPSNKPIVKAMEWIWRAYFPTMYAIIQALKAPALNEIAKNAHKKCARAMQMIESKIMFEYVVPTLRKHPDCVFVTIHDAVRCTSEYAHIVRDAMQFALYEEYNIILPVKEG